MNFPVAFPNVESIVSNVKSKIADAKIAFSNLVTPPFKDSSFEVSNNKSAFRGDQQLVPATPANSEAKQKKIAQPSPRISEKKRSKVKASTGMIYLDGRMIKGMGNAPKIKSRPSTLNGSAQVYLDTQFTQDLLNKISDK